MARWGLSMVGLGLVGACAADGPMMAFDADAGTGDGANARSTEPDPPASPHPAAPPTAPAAPELTPEPAGWQRLDASGVAYALPFPPGDSPGRCTSAGVRFPGDAACHRLGPPCPTGRFAEPEPGTRPTFVDPDAPEGGDGHRETPYRTIEQAFAAPTGDAIVMLSKGIHPLGVSVPGSFRLRGACVAETVLVHAGAAPANPIARAASPGVQLEALTIRGDGSGVVASGPQTTVVLRAVWIESTTGNGISATGGARITGERVVVAGAEMGGIIVTAAAHVGLTRARIEASAGLGVWSDDPDTHVSLTEAVVEGTLSRPGVAMSGFGLAASEGGSLSLRRVLVAENRTTGLLAIGSQTRADLEDVVVADTRVADVSGSDDAHGVELSGGARVAARRVVIRDNAATGVIAFGDGTALDLADSLVLDHGSFGVAAFFGARAELSRVAVERASTMGVVASEGSVLSAMDLQLRHTGATPDRPRVGRGLVVDAATASLERAIIEDSVEMGALCLGDADCLLQDTIIRDSRIPSVSREVTDELTAVGMFVTQSARARLVRARIVDNEVAGLLVQDGSYIEGEDLRVADTGARPGDGFHQGLVLGDADGDFRRVELARNGDVGLSIDTEAPMPSRAVRVEDLSVSEHRTAAGGAVGVNIAPPPDAASVTVTMHRLRVAESGMAAMAIARAANVELRDVELVGADEPTGQAQFGLLITEGAVVDGERLVARRTSRIGVAAALDETRATLRHVRVSNTRPAACGWTDDESCDRTKLGSGVLAAFGSSLAVERFRIEGNALAGAHAVAATLRLSAGVVQGHPIGLHVSGDHPALDELAEDVVFIENTRNLDAERLPLPDFTAGVPAEGG